jgi:acyl-CoA synthetase (AMP-forming)/AMP-acid ligase II
VKSDRSITIQDQLAGPEPFSYICRIITRNGAEMLRPGHDDEWGELIVAAVILKKDTLLNEIELNNWFIQRTAAYKKPRKYLVVNELPRNAMGKVVKNELKKLFNF